MDKYEVRFVLQFGDALDLHLSKPQDAMKKLIEYLKRPGKLEQVLKSAVDVGQIVDDKDVYQDQIGMGDVIALKIQSVERI